MSHKIWAGSVHPHWIYKQTTKHQAKIKYINIGDEYIPHELVSIE